MGRTADAGISGGAEKIAKTVIDNGALALQAKKHLDEYGKGDKVIRNAESGGIK